MKDPNYYEYMSQRPVVVPKEIYAPTLSDLHKKLINTEGKISQNHEQFLQILQDWRTNDHKIENHPLLKKENIERTMQ